MGGWDGKGREGMGTHGWALIAAKVGKRQYIPTLAGIQTDHRPGGREGAMERWEREREGKSVFARGIRDWIGKGESMIAIILMGLVF